MTLPRTPSQTVGPYYAIGLCRRPESDLDPEGIELSGRLLDGLGEPIPDGYIELWDPDGRRWGRSATHPDGRFRFRVPRNAARLEACVHARGLLRHQLTRISLRDPGDAAPGGMVARPDGDGLVFDIRMQGEGATTFFQQ